MFLVLKSRRQLLAMPLLLCGCASHMGVFYNRPVVEDAVRVPTNAALGTLSLTADRRTVLIPLAGDKIGRFCAEPPPDSASGLKAELEASYKDAMRDAKVNDQFSTQVTVLAERTPALDILRTGVYALCQYNLNGAIADAQVEPLFRLLIEQSASIERIRAANPRPAQPVRPETSLPAR